MYFLSYLATLFLVFRHNCTENPSTYFIFNNFILNHSFYEIILKNMVEPHRPRMTIHRITCRVTKATDTHSEYVTFIVFHCNNRCTNAPQCSVTFTLLLLLLSVCFRTLRKEATLNCHPGNSVGVVTGYGLDGPRIESRWKRDFPHLSRPALGPTQTPVQWVPGLSLG